MRYRGEGTEEAQGEARGAQVIAGGNAGGRLAGTGSVSLGHGGSTGNGPLHQIIQAGYAALTSALHAALYLPAALLAGAAPLSAVTLRQRRHAA
jgi:hypothetical protein